jgi:hypothetical protein
MHPPHPHPHPPPPPPPPPPPHAPPAPCTHQRTRQAIQPPLWRNARSAALLTSQTEATRAGTRMHAPTRVRAACAGARVEGSGSVCRHVRKEGREVVQLRKHVRVGRRSAATTTATPALPNTSAHSRENSVPPTPRVRRRQQGQAAAGRAGVGALWGTGPSNRAQVEKAG